MMYVFPPLMGLLITLLNLACPILVLFTLPFIKWDKTETLDREGRDPAIRGDLPRWLSWFSTPDERLPGGLYEDTVHAFYLKHGKLWCSWYWLGVRNCLMGMATALGKPTSDYIPEEPLGYWERGTGDGHIWRYAKHLFTLNLPDKPIRIIFVCGYQVYKRLDGSFQAAPVFTVKRKDA